MSKRPCVIHLSSICQSAVPPPIDLPEVERLRVILRLHSLTRSRSTSIGSLRGGALAAHNPVSLCQRTHTISHSLFSHCSRLPHPHHPTRTQKGLWQQRVHKHDTTAKSGRKTGGRVSLPRETYTPGRNVPGSEKLGAVQLHREGHIHTIPSAHRSPAPSHTHTHTHTHTRNRSVTALSTEKRHPACDRSCDTYHCLSLSSVWSAALESCLSQKSRSSRPQP